MSNNGRSIVSCDIWCIVVGKASNIKFINNEKKQTLQNTPYYFFPGGTFIANFSPLGATWQVIIYQFKWIIIETKKFEFSSKQRMKKAVESFW